MSKIINKIEKDLYMCCKSSNGNKPEGKSIIMKAWSKEEKQKAI